MADLARLRAEILASGRIGEREMELICRELYAEGRLDREVVELLAVARKQVMLVCRSFEELFSEAVRFNVLADGAISAEGAAWLRKVLVLGGGLDSNLKKLLSELQQEARQASPEFQQLCKEYT